MYSSALLRSSQYWQMAIVKPQCIYCQGGHLSPRELQGRYQAALLTLAGDPNSQTAMKHTPIFRREPAATEKQAISDAATALAALWKIGERRKG